MTSTYQELRKILLDFNKLYQTWDSGPVYDEDIAEAIGKICALFARAADDLTPVDAKPVEEE